MDMILERNVKVSTYSLCHITKILQFPTSALAVIKFSLIYIYQHLLCISTSTAQPKDGNNDRLRKVANGIWTSKLRYGLQLYSKVRRNNQDPTNANMDKLQITQNKMARVLENVTLKDKTPTSMLLKNQNMLSVNQISAQIKLTEIWKAINITNFPIKVTKQTSQEDARITRGVTQEKLVEEGSSNLIMNSFKGDAIRLWNKAPEGIKSTKTLGTAKTEIKKFVVTLPI